MKNIKSLTAFVALPLLVVTLIVSLFVLATPVYAAPDGGDGGSSKVTCPDGTVIDSKTACPASLNCSTNNKGEIECKKVTTQDTCGNVKTSFDFGCKGTGNGIIDLLLAVVRFMTVGVGLVLVLMTVISGIQYTMSQGDPAATKAVKLRLFGIGVAAVIYLLATAILNFVIPDGILG